MEASIVDLRYKTTEIVAALDRNESVNIYYHGALKGIINPITTAKKSKNVTKHPFFGMARDETISVEEQINNLRMARI